jgi:PAS domain S-box-containing protein
VNDKFKHSEDQRLAQMLDVISRFTAGDLTARGAISDDDSALDGVMAGINILGEELEASVAGNKRALEFANTLISTSPNGILAVDPELRITEWNLLMEQMCGKSREQAIGQNLAEIPFMQETGEAARIREGLQGKCIGTREVAYRIPGDDKERFFESFMAPLRGGAGQIVGGVLRVRDITEHKRGEQALAGSEVQLSAIFNATQDGILMVDAQSRRFRMANASICRMLGYSQDELLNLTINDIHPEKDLPNVARQFERQVKGEISLATLPVKRKDGSVFYAGINASPITLGGQKYITGIFRDITERMRAEDKILNLNQALEENVQQLLATQEELEQHRAHLEQDVAQRTASLTEAQRIAHLGNWEWDIVNDTLSWSDEIYRIFDLAPQQFGANYEAFLNLVHPEDRQLVDDSMHEALERQHTYSIDHRILQLDGMLRHVHVQAEVIRGEDGQPVSMVGTLQDITKRKQAEEQIRKQQAITSQIIETIPMRVFWKDRSLHYLGCNTVFARDAGKNSPDEMLGKNDFQMNWKEQAELYRADDQRIMDTDTPKLSYDEPQTTPTGERIWLRTSKVPLHNEANEVMGMLGVYEDITEYKRMELDFLESEKRFRNLAELTTDWVWQVDKHGTYVYSGAKIQDLLGYTPEEVIGKTPFDFMPPEEAARTAEIFQDITSKQKPFSFLENITLHKDGHKVVLETSGVPLVADDGAFNGFFGTERDITERKQAEEIVHNLNEELEDKVRERTKQLMDTQDELVRKEKLSTLGQVAGSVGHELRNPLGVMNNAVYFLQTVLTDADETTREYLGILKDEISIADRIVGDLLDSVRTRPPQPEAVEVKALLDQALGKCEIPANVTLRLEIPETLSSLLVDPQQINQVFRNLISNGAEAIPTGGTLEISAVENSSENTITISVRDTGVGITLEGMGRLFQPLFTTKARGIGLGLMVVKNLTEVNGGSIEVQSEADKGTVFSITLPCESQVGFQPAGVGGVGLKPDL